MPGPRTTAALVGALLGLPLASELRVARAVRPLTSRWQSVGVVARNSTLLGISFRPPQVDAQGLDPRRSLATLLDYPFQLIRLGAYWNRIEPVAGRLSFDDLDWQVDAAERAGKQIILAVGALKTFGYPEFFVPPHRLARPLREGRLIQPAQHAALFDAATTFVGAIVERYRDRPAIAAWQVEHEAVDPLGMEHSWRLGTAFVEAEVQAVRRADPRRPILLNGFLPMSLAVGMQQWWRTRDQGDSLAVAIRVADMVGLDVYACHGLVSLGGLTLYLDGGRRPWQRWARNRLFARAQAAGRKLLITEGQAEPWETVTTPPDPRQAVMFSCPPERLIDNYNQCLGWSRRRSLALYAYLFWGAEYWLLRARSGDPSYLRAFARVLESS
ncbi:MAG TPA: beta-galactosidase [Chloroflexota bacterium]